MARPTDYSLEMYEKAKHYKANSTDYGDIVPTIAGLSVVLDVARSTLYLWAKEHDEFSDMLESIMAFQEKELVQNGLTSIFNPVITKLMLAKHGYADKQELTGKDGDPLFDAEAKAKGKAAITEYLGTTGERD